MTITYNLDQNQKGRLFDLLRENKGVLEWTLGDIKGINPIIVEHRIQLDNNAKSYQDRQRRLNPSL